MASAAGASAVRASGEGDGAIGAPKLSSLSARMSVRRHSSSRSVGIGVARKAVNASRRRSATQPGSSLLSRNAAKAASVNPWVIGVVLVPVARALLIAVLISRFAGQGLGDGRDVGLIQGVVTN